jgi:hypothetical protein
MVSQALKVVPGGLGVQRDGTINAGPHTPPPPSASPISVGRPPEALV